MTKSVTVRQAKYFMDRIKRNDLPYLKVKEHEVFDKVLDLIESNKLYNEIWKQIEKEAKKMVDDLKPKVEEVAKRIWEYTTEYNKLAKEADWKVTDEMVEVRKKANEASDEYEKIYSDAQKELDNYKIKVITEDNRWVKLIDITNKAYNVIDSIISWTIDESPKKSISDNYETKIWEEELK